ncbi:hypothetical protein L1049_004244 [Liquidambar formosana]|uniref:Uncharacterized protein n=1 Tax=Liquidambar formosana TaxID=63359 RepID=A0AAP0RSJ7_LIQFO
MGTPVKRLFDQRPHVSAWCGGILSRPAWTKVVEMVEEGKAFVLRSDVATSTRAQRSPLREATNLQEYCPPQRDPEDPQHCHYLTQVGGPHPCRTGWPVKDPMHHFPYLTSPHDRYLLCKEWIREA